MYTHTVDEANARVVHVVFAELIQDLRIVDRLGFEVLVPFELRTAKQERQEMVVVQTPHTMAARRLQPVRRLHVAHHLDVPPKDAQDKSRRFARQIEDAQLDKAHSVMR